MPELPEVETTRRGLESLVTGKTIQALVVRDGRLRWPVAADLDFSVNGQRLRAIGRRGKYLLFELDSGALIVHLGMSGSIRFVPSQKAAAAHDHVDLRFTDGSLIRYNDPRRFGSFHFAHDASEHPLLKGLGPEPLGPDFSGGYLHAVSRGRRVAIKNLLMNARVVVGVGNIYANEALYRAGIHPSRAAGRISLERAESLVAAVRQVLGDAIAHGGTTLRDFVGGDGRPGYFKQSLNVYDRAGEPCRRCAEAIRLRVIGQRASYYCARCQH